MFRPENGEPGRSNEARHAESQTRRVTLVPAVAKAFKILELISQSDDALGTSELARRLTLGKSTVHGLVTTLEALGMLEPANGAKRYRLGRGLHALVGRLAQQRDLRDLARASLERLAVSTEQTSFLGVPADGHVTVLDTVHGRPTMSISAPVGSSIPLLAGAVGKAILASWDQRRREAFLEEHSLPAFTPKSIVDPVAYRRSVEDAVARGAAVDLDEFVDGVRAAAAPIFGTARELVGVLWVAGFTRHIDRARLLSLASDVAREANEISRKLGAEPTL